MNRNESVKATGALSVVLTGADGKLKQRVDVPNLVVTAGLGYIASRMKDAAATAMSHMAVGSGNTAAAAGQTALQTEAGRAALVSTTVNGAQVEYMATFGPGVGTAALTEAGIFNNNAAGTMLCRTVFGVVTKEAGDTLVITWTVTLSA